MPIIKCKMCGGDIQLSEDKTFGTCEYCGSTMTFPKLADEQRAAAFNRGNAFRRAGEFDKALSVYERIAADDDTDAEAHWCCALCRFGIEWVEDPNTYEYVPTCHRASFDSFLEDVDYKAALQYSDGVTRRQYQRDGARINEVQRGILATSQHEKPFDVFICYKELDDDGNRTRDSLDAQEIYYNLTQEGYRVFFSRITLEDKVGTEYEPYIFAALNSAKVMVVLGSKPEYFNAVWVKNEWSRYLTLMHKDRSKLLLPCYKNMDPYDLPDQLSVLMSYDMTKIGFMQDLLRGIRKVLKKDEPKPTQPQVVVQQSGGPNVDSLLQRAFIFLEDKDWQSADEYCERVLDQAPKTALAYLGKLMVELHVSHREALEEQETPFDDKNNYQRAIRYGDAALRDELEGYNAAIRARLEEKRLTGIYNDIQNAAQRARTESEWLALAERFEALASFKDARRQAENCRKKAETARRAAAFDKAAAAMNAASSAEDYEEAARLFGELPGFRDAEQKAALCREKAEETRLEDEKRKAEAAEKRQREQETKKAAGETKQAVVIQPKRKPAAAIIAAILAVLLIGGGITVWKLPEIRQELAYKQAVEALNAGDYETAIDMFIALEDYKESPENLKSAKYLQATALLEAGDYETAIPAFTALRDYKDSVEKATEAYNASAYARAEKLLAEGDYEAAITAFTELGDYKDSAAKISEAVVLKTESDNALAYAKAEELLNAGEYMAARNAFTALGDYKDSAERANTIGDRYQSELLKQAEAGDTVLFGSYEQDNDKNNGQETIEWLVLAREDDRILVISRYALDCQQYNTENIHVTWETCTLRKWLNDSFLNAAFSAEEQAMIPIVTVSADKVDPADSWADFDQGNDTRDAVFLLSEKEIKKYFSVSFSNKSARACSATAWAKAQGVSTLSSNGKCRWWLRTSSTQRNNSYTRIGRNVAYYVDLAGDYRVDDVNKNIYAVRPAMWIEIDG